MEQYYYTLIFEDFTIKVERNWSDDWLESIDAGVLTVIRTDTEPFDLMPDGEWKALTD